VAPLPPVEQPPVTSVSLPPPPRRSPTIPVIPAGLEPVACALGKLAVLHCDDVALRVKRSFPSTIGIE